MTKDRKTIIQYEYMWEEQESPRRYWLDELLYDPPVFDSVIQSALNFLQGRPGELVLDMGGGEGKETLELVSHGMTPINLDLSYRQLCRARERVQRCSPASPVYFVQANAEEMPFATGSFRIVYGKAILHHLDLDRAATEIKRVLQVGGRATFAEPMADHPIFWLARRLTPRLRTLYEHPMRLSELVHFSRQFRCEELQVYFLTAPLAFPLRLVPKGEKLFQWVFAFLHRLDTKLFHWLPGLRKYAWYGVIMIHKDSDGSEEASAD